MNVATCLRDLGLGLQKDDIDGEMIPSLTTEYLTDIRFAIYTAHDVATWARVVGSTPSARWIEQKSGNAASIEITNPHNALDLALAGTAGWCVLVLKLRRWNTIKGM